MNDTIWVCTHCKIVPSSQSSRRCFKCGSSLTQWDLSKNPLERMPEWPFVKDNTTEFPSKEVRIDYTQFYDKNNDKKNNDEQ